MLRENVEIRISDDYNNILPVDCMLNMYHPEFSGAVITVKLDI